MNIARFLQLSLPIKIVTAVLALISFALFVSYQSRLAADAEAHRRAQERAAVQAAVRTQMMQLPAEGFQRSPVWGSPTP
jgi:hypothetical protein